MREMKKKMMKMKKKKKKMKKIMSKETKNSLYKRTNDQSQQQVLNRP